MATDQLNPTTRQKLRELAKRRRVLLVMRGLFAGVLTLLIAMAAVALVDRFVVLGQGIRIAISLAAYLAVAVVVYRVSLRYLLRFPSAARLAMLIESAEPQLREDLISAVELAENSSSAYDSPAFREVLQQKVAQKIERVETDRVLPWKMVAWWAGVSLGAIAITTALVLTPGLRYGDLLTRALLPTADLDRVSDVRITLISPELDADGRVPMNASLPITVEVKGGEFDDVVVELVEAKGKRDNANMRPDSESSDRYTTELAISDRPIKFRIRAGDGQTRYFELDPTARPAVDRFTQVIHPPSYTQRTETRMTGMEGTIDALAGSVVDMALRTNQPIKSGRLILQLLDGERVVPLYVDPGDATLLTTSMPIDKSGSYRVELVALQTQFVNEDAREYEITARPDALPTVKLITPEGLHAEPNDALMKLRGLASDDVGLSEVMRETRINGGAWLLEEVATNGRGQVAAPLDLLPMGLSVGDEVEIRLAATDLAGNTAHSVSARIIVTPNGFERTATKSARDQRELLDVLNKAIANAQQAAKLYSTARTVAGNTQSIEHQQTLTRALSAESELQDAIMRAGRAVNTAMRSARPGAEVERVLQVGRSIAEAQMRTASQPFSSTDASAMEQAEKAVNQSHNSLRTAASALKIHVAARQSAITQHQSRNINDDLARVHKRAKENEQVDRELAEERIRRRLQLSNLQAASLVADMKFLSELPGVRNYRDRYKESVQQLTPLLERQQEILLGETAFEAIMTSTKEMQQKLDEARLRQWPAWVFLADTDRDEQKRQRGSVKLVAEAIGDLKKQAKQGKAEAAFDSVIEYLQRTADLEESRKSTDNSFVAMTNMAVRSLSQLRIDRDLAQTDEKWAEGIDTIYKSYRTIERVQSLIRLRSMVVSLANAEHAGVETKGIALEQRLDWSAIKPRFELVEQSLRREKTLEQAANLTRDAARSPEARQVDRSIHFRRSEKQTPESQHEELQAIARMLSEAIQSAAPALAQARAELSAKTPSLPDRLRDLSKQAEQLSQQSEKAAEQAKTQTEPEVIDKAKALADQQERMNAQLASLAEQLRIEANQQDLFTEKGREAARDFDDAIAMIKPDAEKATEQLALAQRETTREHERPQAVAEAAESQQATADKLDQLADHFEKLEQGEPKAESTRQALRQNEEELGVKEKLDEQYERMERLSELAELSDAERLAELEKQLEKDRNMQRELDRITGDLTDQAKKRLEDAARQEQALADQLEQADQKQQVGKKALEELAERARELEQQRVVPLAEKAKKAVPKARKALDQAKEALQQAAEQGDANEQQTQDKGTSEQQQPRAEKLAEQAREAAKQLKQAEKDAQQAEKDARNQQKQAREKANEAKRQGQPSDQAEQAAKKAEAKVKEAANVRKEAQDSAKKADAIAREAEKLSDQTNKQDQQAKAQQEQAVAEQAQLAEETDKASEELERAARHEERLGDNQSAEALADSAKETRGLADKKLPETADKLAKEDQVAKAEEALLDAEDALREQVDKIESAEQKASPQDDAAEGEAQASEEQTAGEKSPSDAGEQGQEGDRDPGENQGEAQGQSQGNEPGEQAGQAPGESSDESQGEAPGNQSGGQSAQQGEQNQGNTEASDGQGEQQDGSPQPGNSEPDNRTPAPLPRAVAEQLARELDRLDEALSVDTNPNANAEESSAQGEGQSPTQDQASQGSQGQAQGQSQAPGQGEAQAQGDGQPPSPGEGQSPSESQVASGSRPIDQAAQAQAQAIRDARASAAAPGQPGEPGQPGQSQAASSQQGQPGEPGQQPGSGDGQDPNDADSDFDPSELVDAEDDGRRDWGNLPERLAEDLSRSQRERAPAEYLDQVDAYFRAIARRAQEQSNED